jgi:hypothetical protein
MKTSRTKYSKANMLLKFIKDEDFIKSIKEKWKNGKPVCGEPDSCNFIISQGYINFYTAGYENIFIETSELYNFLKDTKVVNSGDISNQLFNVIKDRKYSVYRFNDIIFRLYNYFIYAPINNTNTAIGVSLLCTENKITNPVSVEDVAGDILTNCMSIHLHESKIQKDAQLCNATYLDNESMENINERLNDKNTKDMDKKMLNYWGDNFRIAINTLYYMNAFPDYVSDGVPKRAIIDEECFTKKRITLSPNKEFFEKLEKSPHLRRGHFRTFTSDYYKNMKGKTIWIEPVFVKGKAVTVIDGVSA